MRRLTVFNHVSLDGYFCDAKGDMSWAHRQDPEWSEFMSENASSSGALVFGRVTYELMASYWPTAAAHEAHPAAAEGMTRAPKVVFSRTLTDVSWENTTLVNPERGSIAAAAEAMKTESGPDLVILGSGSIVSFLSREGLIDAYTFVVSPIVLGSGRTLFEGVEKRLALALKQSRAFGNGNVVLEYERVS